MLTVSGLGVQIKTKRFRVQFKSRRNDSGLGGGAHALAIEEPELLILGRPELALRAPPASRITSFSLLSLQVLEGP